MAEIRVDIMRLEDLSKQLNLLRCEFEGLEDRVDDHRAAVGRAGKLSDALDDLASNWSDKRKEVVAELAAFSELALQTAQHYRDLEAALASGFSSASGAMG